MKLGAIAILRCRSQTTKCGLIQGRSPTLHLKCLKSSNIRILIPASIFLYPFFSELIDSWSAGVILYLMLAGSHPFQAELYWKLLWARIYWLFYIRKADLIEKITAGLYEMNGETWDKVSEEAKDLVENLLQKKAEDRYTPFQILAHPWILNVKQLCWKIKLILF